MPKRTVFTNITPLPAQVSREIAIAMLHNHDEMIELNPLVIEHHPIKPPKDAPADEFLDCAWQELTDRVHYLPGGLMKGKVTYKACFHDVPTGLETHVYAPMGLEIRERWTIGGSLPGEPREARELGLNTPATGLYLREDGDMKCSSLLTSFVRKNLDNSHKVLVERILLKAERVETHIKASSDTASAMSVTSFQPGSHMARSSFANADASEASQTSAMSSPVQSFTVPRPPTYGAWSKDRYAAPTHRADSPSSVSRGENGGRPGLYTGNMQPNGLWQASSAPPQEFLAELPDNSARYLSPETTGRQQQQPPQLQHHRSSTASELSADQVPSPPARHHEGRDDQSMTWCRTSSDLRTRHLSELPASSMR